MTHSRIPDLRRRVEQDPQSIAFAQLAEEYRRAGDSDAAVQTCRAGLVHHPGHLSARVTLARALMELGRLADAQDEIEYVLRAAPDHVSAIRALAELDRGRGGAPLGEPPPPASDPALAAFEAWLDAILADRASRAAGGRAPDRD